MQIFIKNPTPEQQEVIDLCTAIFEKTRSRVMKGGNAYLPIMVSGPLLGTGAQLAETLIRKIKNALRANYDFASVTEEPLKEVVKNKVRLTKCDEGNIETSSVLVTGIVIADLDLDIDIVITRSLRKGGEVKSFALHTVDIVFEPMH